MHSQEEGQPEKRPRTEISDIETEAAGGEVGPSQLHYKKGHMDFVKDHEELHNKTSGHYKDKARKEFFWVEFTRSCKLSAKVCKTWFDSQRTCYWKLMQFKSGQAPKEMMEHQTCIQDKLGFLRSHIRHKGLSKSSAFKS